MVGRELYFTSLFPYNLLVIQGEESPSVWRLAPQSPDLLWMLKDLQQHHLCGNTTGSGVGSKAALQPAGNFPLTLTAFGLGLAELAFTLAV